MKKSKVAQELIIQCTPRAVKARRALISFYEKPLAIGENPATSRRCAYTTGIYTIKFKPGVPGMEKKPFAFNIDFLPGHRLRVPSYATLKSLGKKNERIDWLVRNTNISPALFKIARQHIDTPISFGIKWEQLEDKLIKNGETRKDFLWEVSE
jgi:hypothetical protein